MSSQKSKAPRATIKKGDQVVVISGNKQDKGKVGEVLSVDPKENKLVVKGVNLRTFHKKPTMQNQKGSRIQKEAPIARSNVMLFDPEAKKGVRIQHKVLESGEKVRTSQKTGASLDV